MNNSWLIHGHSCFIFNINFHELFMNFYFSEESNFTYSEIAWSISLILMYSSAV